MPVVLDGASIPETDHLTDDLKPLAHINALKISRACFDADVARLVQQVEQVLEMVNPEFWRLEKDELELWRQEYRRRTKE